MDWNLQEKRQKSYRNFVACACICVRLKEALLEYSVSLERKRITEREPETKLCSAK
jgi:hypothetical protein